MTTLFTPPQRQNIYNTIIEQLKGDDRITGIIAVGAHDSPFTDDDDGIDLLVVIEKPSIIDIVFTLWVKRIEDMFAEHILFDIILDEDANQLSILLDNYLQISVQIRAVNRFHMVGDDWCIVFDRQHNLQSYIDTRRLTHEQHILKTYEQHIHTIWHPIVACVRELRRDNLWKANAELGILRRHVIEIAGLRHSHFTQSYKNMNHLPEMFLVQLRHTLPTNITESAIRRSLKMTLGMLFNETARLDMQFDTDHTAQLEDRLSTFVEAYA